MLKKRIYKFIPDSIYTVQRGWTKIKNTKHYLQLHSEVFKNKETNYGSCKFYIDILENKLSYGTEDFFNGRFHDMNLKQYSVTLRLYGEGKGLKKVTKELIEAGCFYGDKKDIKKYIEIKYKSDIEKGYIITWIKH